MYQNALNPQDIPIPDDLQCNHDKKVKRVMKDNKEKLP